MSAPVPLWKTQGHVEETGMAPGQTPDEVEAFIGLAYDSQNRLVHPRVEALRMGTLKVEDLDDEELVRGQVRDASGKFIGSPQRKIPREFHDELMRRIIENGQDKLRANYLKAIDAMVDLMSDEDTDDALRFNIAKYVVERLAGKTPERVEATVAIKPWEIALKGIVKELPPDGFFDPIMDGEVLSEEPSEDEDDEPVGTV